MGRESPRGHEALPEGKSSLYVRYLKLSLRSMSSGPERKTNGMGLDYLEGLQDNSRVMRPY